MKMKKGKTRQVERQGVTRNDRRQLVQEHVGDGFPKTTKQSRAMRRTPGNILKPAAKHQNAADSGVVGVKLPTGSTALVAGIRAAVLALGFAHRFRLRLLILLLELRLYERPLLLQPAGTIPCTQCSMKAYVLSDASKRLTAHPLKHRVMSGETWGCTKAKFSGLQ